MTTATPHIDTLDLADLLAARHADTPLWNELLANYDAEAVDAITTGWPDPQATTAVEPGEEPTEPEPAEVEPDGTPAPVVPDELGQPGVPAPVDTHAVPDEEPDEEPADTEVPEPAPADPPVAPEEPDLPSTV